MPRHRRGAHPLRGRLHAPVVPGKPGRRFHENADDNAVERARQAAGRHLPERPELRLEESGFPAGTEELTANSTQLANIAIVEKSGPGGPVPNFSLVQLVGCLTQGANKAWMLTNGTEPTRAAESGDSPAADSKASASLPLGKGSFRLLDYPALGREARRGTRSRRKGS